MIMKKIISIMFAIVVALSFVSCENASSSKISGMWIAQTGGGTVKTPDRTFIVLDFVNKNTVNIYYSVADVNDLYEGSKPFPNHSGYYYNPEYKTYTYAIEDNKIFITNGYILTIVSKNCLRQDGESYSYSPF